MYSTEDATYIWKNLMNQQILVVYASKCGSTAEVAKSIGNVLSQLGAVVTVLPTHQVRSLKGYNAVVLGTAIRMNKPLSEMRFFAYRFRRDLAKVPTAAFSVGLILREDTPENRAEAARFLAPLLERLANNKSTATFGGKLDYQTLPPFFRAVFSKDASGAMAEGDYRDWNAIHNWATALPAALGLPA